MSTALAAWRLDAEQIDLIKTAFARGATDAELSLFIQTCHRLQLDPFARQIFLVKRWDNSLRREVATTQVSIDGFRLIAERTRQYRGQTAPEWCGPDGAWREVWLSDEPPAAARVGVHREGFVEPMRRIARWAGYAQYTKDGHVNTMWRQYGEIMLSKCAEALALRAAFPHELSGVYTDDEMPADGRVIDATPMRPANDAEPARRTPPATRPAAPQLSAPRTIEEFMQLETKPRPEPVVVEREPAPKTGSPFDPVTGETLPEPADLLPSDPPVPAPKAVDNVHRLPAQKPSGNEPVWPTGPHKGKRYSDTPRAYLTTLLGNSWAKTASSHQLAWARYAIALRTEHAHNEGRA